MTQPPTEVRLYRNWLLYLGIRIPFGGWLTGPLIFVALFSFYKYFSDPLYMNTYAIVFLSAMIGYVVPVYAVIINRSQQAFDALSHLVQLDESRRRDWRKALDHSTLGHHIYASGSGFLLGICHVMILEAGRTGSVSTILHNTTAQISAFGTLLVWLVLTTVISAITRNAIAFYHLSRDHLRIDLLHARELIPLAWVSVVSTLSLIGAQALFGLLVLDQSGWDVLLPGTLGIAVPMVPMFLLPIWPVHKRLQALKKKELDSINKKLNPEQAFMAQPLEHAESLGQLNNLLAYRREIQAVPEWPFDLGAMSRLGFYLIIPPLTWVGAALIENLVDSVI